MRTSIFMAIVAIVGAAMADATPAPAAGPQAKQPAKTYHSRGDIRHYDGAWSYDTWRGLRRRERVRAYAQVAPPGYYRPRAYYGTQRYLPPQPPPPGWERPHIPGEPDPGPFPDYR